MDEDPYLKMVTDQN